MIKSITLDTFTGIMTDAVLDKKMNMQHKDWKDYGIEITRFLLELRKRGFTLAAVLGYPGSGKTYGMKFLKPETNIWFNADDKPATWKGAKEIYGTPNNPTKFQVVPKTYGEILQVIDAVKKSGNLADEPIAFCLGHIEEFTVADGKKRLRLKTLGNLAKKLDIENNLSLVYYTYVVSKSITEPPEFYLRTVANGFDTCRTLEDLHESPLIPNDYNQIIEALDNY